MLLSNIESIFQGLNGTVLDTMRSGSSKLHSRIIYLLRISVQDGLITTDSFTETWRTV